MSHLRPSICNFRGEQIFTSSQRSHRPGVSKEQIWGKMYFAKKKHLLITYPLISLRSPLKNKNCPPPCCQLWGELVNTFYFVALMLMKNNSTREPKACISSTQKKNQQLNSMQKSNLPSLYKKAGYMGVS